MFEIVKLLISLSVLNGVSMYQSKLYGINYHTASLTKWSMATDPLDNIKQVKYEKNANQKYGMKVMDENKYSQESNLIKLNSSLTSESQTSLSVDRTSTSERFKQIESEVIQNAPLFLLHNFYFLLGQYMTRLSLISVTFHLMLLIPTIRYLKVVQHQDPTFLLYLGPIVFILPYLFLWLWEANIYTISYIQNGLKSFLINQQENAQDNWNDVQNQFNRISNEFPFQIENEKLIYSYFYIKYLLKININIIIQDLVQLKLNENWLQSDLFIRQYKNRMEFNHLQDWIQNIQLSYKSDVDNTSMNQIVQSIISEAKKENFTSYQILNELKKIQVDLEDHSSWNGSSVSSKMKELQ